MILFVFLLFVNISNLSPYRFESRCNGDWLKCRQRLINETFGFPDLPNRSPDWILPSKLTPEDNRTALVWEISVKHGPTLNATVYWTLNNTGHAPRNFLPQEFHPTKGGEWRWPIWPKKAPASKTLVLYHNGHECDNPGVDLDLGPSFFNSLGLDVMEFDMPLFGWNKLKDVKCEHEYFEIFALLGAKCMRYFVEPVMLATNFALDKLGYERVVMVGLSGGGWTTTFAAALTDRIEMSFPIAGGVPYSMRDFFHDSWDWEQKKDRDIYHVATFLDWMVLGGYESNRAQLQILHEMDSCCWCSCGRENDIIEYNDFVQKQVLGGFRTAVTTGNIHEVNSMDRVLTGFFIGMPEAKYAFEYLRDPSLPLPYDHLYKARK